VRPQPSRLFGCGPAALWSRLFSPGSPPGLPPALVGQTFLSAAGISCGASRQACHTGAPVEQAVLLATPDACVEQAARLAMPAVTPAEPHNPDCTGVPSTPSGPHDRALHLNPPPLSPSPCPPCPLWFAFSVPSVSCPMWGRLSSLRPAFQPAWVPFTHCPLFRPTAPPPSGASRQACHAGGHAGRATQSQAVREFPRHPPPRLAAWHARLRAPPQPAAPCGAVCSSVWGRLS
jgi:hypothetical protein